MTYEATAPSTAPAEVRAQIRRLLDEFVADTADVTHALLVSRDGMKQVIPAHMDPDWADSLAAVFSGMAGLAKGVTGPTSKQMPARQVIIERDDTLFMVTEAGAGKSFTAMGTTVATVLVVLARTDANVGGVAFAAGLLVQRFAHFMTTPVPTRDGQGSGVE